MTEKYETFRLLSFRMLQTTPASLTIKRASDQTSRHSLDSNRTDHIVFEKQWYIVQAFVVSSRIGYIKAMDSPSDVGLSTGNICT